MGAQIQPIDILAGLGVANRAMLATGLALFEDAALMRQLDARWGKTREKIAGEGASAVAKGVASRRTFWVKAALPDDTLRLVLWIYLRDGFGLPARLCLTRNSAALICDDIAAAAVSVGRQADPNKKDTIATLDAVVQPVLDALIRSALSGDEGGMSDADRQQLLTETRQQLEAMGAAEQKRLLERVGADRLTDDAVRKVLLTGGAFGAFGGAVSMAGFSAYILAAKASAFIPLVSGPALVSMVSILANPITAIGGTAYLAWHAGSSVRKKSQLRVAVIVSSLLGLQGISKGQGGVARMLECFRGCAVLKPVGDLSSELIAEYQKEWQLLEGAIGKPGPRLDDQIVEWMDRPANDDGDPDGRLGRLFAAMGDEKINAALLGVVTLGDVVYAAASIDSRVIASADFSRVEDIDGVTGFAAFADRIVALDPIAAVGAVSNLKGYVAERVVAAQLVSQGHQVSFPEDSNEAGWDLMVDGKKMQVKCRAGIDGLAEHFEKYDYPVIANAELADVIATSAPAWADKVFFVEGYSDEMVSSLTDRSLDAGADMLNPDVPLFAVALSAVRNGLGYWSGQVSGTQAAAQVILDGGTRAGLAAVGGFAGKGLGFLLLGPAGALVLGSTLPVLAQTQSGFVKAKLDEFVSSDSYRAWSAEADGALKALGSCLHSAIDAKTQVLREKYQTLRANKGPLAEYAKARFAEDARFLRECKVRLSSNLKGSSHIEGKVVDVIGWLASAPVHPVLYQDQMRRFNQVMSGRPLLGVRLREQVVQGATAVIVAGRKLRDVASGFWNQTDSGTKKK